MKKFYLFLLLLITLSVQSQNQKEQVFEKYYLKSNQTGNRPVLMSKPFIITQFENEKFTLKINITDSDYYNVGLSFIDQFDFAGKRTYTYEGVGDLAGMPLEFALESTVQLKDLVKGNAYKPGSETEMGNFELHLLYWPLGESEPMMKPNSYFYPVSME